MIVNDKIKFERQRTDPNVLVKVSVTLMIVTLNAVQNEVVTPLLKQGSSFGYQQCCYVCRLHGELNNMQWASRECNMPLCNHTP